MNRAHKNKTHKPKQKKVLVGRLGDLIFFFSFSLIMVFSSANCS